MGRGLLVCSLRKTWGELHLWPVALCRMCLRDARACLGVGSGECVKGGGGAPDVITCASLS